MSTDRVTGTQQLVITESFYQLCQTVVHVAEYRVANLPVAVSQPINWRNNLTYRPTERPVHGRVVEDHQQCSVGCCYMALLCWWSVLSTLSVSVSTYWSETVNLSFLPPLNMTCMTFSIEVTCQCINALRHPVADCVYTHQDEKEELQLTMFTVAY